MTKLLFVLSILLVCSCVNIKKPTNNLKTEINLVGKDIPELVAPGIINQGLYVRDLVMTPDQKEIYYTVVIGRFHHAHIVYMKYEKEQWSEPEIASFANNPKFKYFEPCISPDGKRFFFVSNQTDGEPTGNFVSNIWVMNREEDKWSEPFKLGPKINTASSEYFPSVAENGTLYFTREDSVSKRNNIYRSMYDGEKYLEAEKLPEQINTGQDRFNSTIAADESFIIIPLYGMEDSYGSVDYYICFKNDNDQWSLPINMGSKINTESGEEYAASISPDRKTMYFMSTRLKKLSSDSVSFSDLKSLSLKPESGKANIYKISTAFIDDLKKQAIFN